MKISRILAEGRQYSLKRSDFPLEFDLPLWGRSGCDPSECETPDCDHLGYLMQHEDTPYNRTRYPGQPKQCPDKTEDTEMTQTMINWLSVNPSTDESALSNGRHAVVYCADAGVQHSMWAEIPDGMSAEQAAEQYKRELPPNADWSGNEEFSLVLFERGEQTTEIEWTAQDYDYDGPWYSSE